MQPVAPSPQTHGFRGWERMVKEVKVVPRNNAHRFGLRPSERRNVLGSILTKRVCKRNWDVRPPWSYNAQEKNWITGTNTKFIIGITNTSTKLAQWKSCATNYRSQFDITTKQNGNQRYNYQAYYYLRIKKWMPNTIWCIRLRIQLRMVQQA